MPEFKVARSQIERLVDQKSKRSSSVAQRDAVTGACFEGAKNTVLATMAESAEQLAFNSAEPHWLAWPSQPRRFTTRPKRWTRRRNA